MTDYCISLAEASGTDAVGGKAWSLSRLARLGVSVPDGFVLSTAAFERFAGGFALGVDLEDLPLDDPAAFEIDIPDLTMPKDVRDTVLRRWEADGGGDGAPWIVRSSAVGEDGEDASFAGQLDSVLHVRTADDLVDAVLACWRSYWTPHVLFYQRARGQRLQGMGVVVQRMVEAVRGGVLFTVDPEAPERAVIEWVDEHPSVLVDGSVTPRRRLVSRDAPDDLTREALRVEAAFGRPQDIEWVVDRDERTWLVQSRPIVGVAAAPPGAGRTKVFSNVNVNENYPAPLSPLLYSIARESYEHYFRNIGRMLGVRGEVLDGIQGSLRNTVGAHGGRLYYDLTNIHASIAAAPNGRMLASAFDGFVGVNDEGTLEGHTRVEREPKGAGRPSRRDALRSVLVATRSLAKIDVAVSRFEGRVDAYVESTRSLDGATRAELLAHLRGFLRLRFDQWQDASIADTAATLSYAALRGLLRRSLGDEAARELPQTLLLAVPNVVSAGPVDALWELSRIARSNERDRAAVAASDLDAATPRFQRAVDRYIRAWGFRVSGELMLSTRTFEDEPHELLRLVAEYVDLDGPSPTERTAVQAARRERTLSSLSLGPWRPLVQMALRATFAGIRYRERARLKQALLYSRLRAITRAVTSLTGHDVTFLTWRELDAWLSGHAMFSEPGDLIALRRRQHHAFAAMRPPDTIRLPEGSYLPPDESADDAEPGRVLHGVGVSGGVVDGVARVIPTLAERGAFERGDVLVTRQTDPGWAPLFFLAGGLVVERGGMLSHGAIVAREFGIPAVIAVPNVTAAIGAEEHLRVDANRGEVHRLSNHATAKRGIGGEA